MTATTSTPEDLIRREATRVPVPVLQTHRFSQNQRWADAVRAERERMFPGGKFPDGDGAPDPIWAVLMALPGALTAFDAGGATEDGSQAHLPAHGEGGVGEAKAMPTEPSSNPSNSPSDKELSRTDPVSREAVERLRALAFDLNTKGREGKRFSCGVDRALDSAAAIYAVLSPTGEGKDQERREQIARIIDPEAFAAGFAPERGAVQNDIDRACEAARSKADAILALSAPPQPEQGLAAAAPKLFDVLERLLETESYIDVCATSPFAKLDEWIKDAKAALDLARAAA